LISNKNLKKIKFGILLGCLFYFIFASQIRVPLFDIRNDKTENNVKLSLDPIHDLSGTSIYIDNTHPSYDWAAFQAAYAWCTGDGSALQPYIISQVLTTTITIKNSDVYFEITWCDQSGISLNNVTIGTLLYNDCSGSTGISLYDCHNNTIFYNDFSALYGISAEYCTYNEIYSNNFLGYSRGIDFDHCFNNTIDENIISLSEDYGVFLYESGYNNVTRNDISTSDCGVYLASANHNFVFNNTIHDITDDWSYGVYLSGGVYNNISKNIIERCKMTGLYLEGDFNTISDNIFDTINEIGIKVESCSNFNLKGNILTNIAEFGISLINSETGDVVENLLYGCGFNVDGNPSLMSNLNLDISNQVNSKPVYFHEGITGLTNGDIVNAGQIILYSCDLGDLSNLNLNHCSMGIGLYYCESTSISDSEFSYNIHSGIKVKSSNYTTITSINALRNRNGITFEESNDINITKSTLSYNEVGIYGGYISQNAGTNANLVNNIITYNNNSGIHIMGGNYALINENRLENNKIHGIYLSHESSFNNISNNIARYNIQAGICLELSSYNVISDNTASYNKDFGIFLYYAYYNYVHKNILNSNIEATLSYDRDAAGIRIWSSYNLVTENSMKGNKESINMGGVNNSIINNNLFDSVYISGARNLNFSKNLLTGSMTEIKRIYLIGNTRNSIFIENELRWANFRLQRDSDNNTFIRNILSDCKIAFYFDDCSYNKVINNSIYRASECFAEYGDSVGNVFSGNYCEEGFFLPIEVIYTIVFGSIALIGVTVFLILKKRKDNRKLNQ